MQSKYSAGGMSHILDDFFFIGPSNSKQCHVDLTNFLLLCEHIGVPIKKKKPQMPTTTLVIHGIEVDSVVM